MQELITKIEELRKALGAMKPKSAANSLVPALKLPTVKPLSMPAASATAPKPKLPGMSPTSTKDPKKMAEQLKNPRPKKPKIEVLKAELPPTHYRIHVDGQPVTEPMPLNHIIERHGSVKHIESVPNHKVIPVKAPEMPKVSKNGQWSLTKAEPDFRAPKKIGFDKPHVDTANPMNIHADRHGFGGSMNMAHKGQKDLIHGINMSSGTPLKENTATKGNLWMHNPHSDKHMIVKPASGAEFNDPKAQDFLGHHAPDGLNAARREVLSHNLAHDAGLGGYFPTTAGFTHRGDDYSAQEKVAGPQVRAVKRNSAHPKRQHLADTMKHMHGTGDLHKLAIFDALMGNNDRHSGNMILDPNEKKIHHIDSGRSIDYSSMRQSEPSGLLAMAQQHGLPDQLHPKAQKWLNSLDEKDATGKLENYVEGNSKFKKNFLERLHNLKTMLQGNPDMPLHAAISNLSKLKRSDLGKIKSKLFDSTVKKFGENNSV